MTREQRFPRLDAPRTFDIHDAGFTARFKRQQGGVFAEGIAVLEAQQRSIAAKPGLKLRA